MVEKEAEQEIRADSEEELVQAVYANHFSLAVSDVEAVLDFAFEGPALIKEGQLKGIKRTMVARVITSRKGIEVLASLLSRMVGEQKKS